MDGMAMSIYQNIDAIQWRFPYYCVGEPVAWELMKEKFDWFSDMIGVPQDRQWHAEGDVYTHTKMVVEALIALDTYQTLSTTKKHILFASALFHDIEKRSTTKEENIDGVLRITSAKHAKFGESTVREILYRDIPTPFIIREQIAKLVRLHGLPLFSLQKRDPTKEVIKASLMVDTSLLYLLAKADVLGRECHDKEEVLLNIELFKALCNEENCFGQPKSFASNHARFLYLNREDISKKYIPYDDRPFCVYLLSALPGTGKDHYSSIHFDDLPILSLDAIRRTHKIKPTDKKGNGRVIQMAKEKARVYMRQKRSFIFNATNTTRDIRSRWISLFLDYNAKIKIIYLEVPYQTLLRQNRDRDYSVPIDVITRLLKRLDIPLADEAHEIEYVTREKYDQHSIML
jgi:predicted kinase